MGFAIVPVDIARSTRLCWFGGPPSAGLIVLLHRYSLRTRRCGAGRSAYLSQLENVIELFLTGLLFTEPHRCSSQNRIFSVANMVPIGSHCNVR
jgi:hypothetical protein